MISVLVVEDDENKRERLRDFLLSGRWQCNLSYAKSYQSGLRLLLNQSFDVVLLDMSIPTFDVTSTDDGGRPQAFGGRELLKQMDRRGLSAPVIVVTQFARFGDHTNALTLDQLDAALRKEHPSNYRGSVYYDSGFEGWRDELSTVLDRLLGGPAR